MRSSPEETSDLLAIRKVLENKLEQEVTDDCLRRFESPQTDDVPR